MKNTTKRKQTHLSAAEFRDLIASASDAYWVEYLEVGAATFRRWKTGKSRIPAAVVKLIRCMRNGDFSAFASDETNASITKKSYALPSQKTQWAYWMQAIEPASKELNEAFPDYHPLWVQRSQRYTIRPESLKGMRQMLHMTETECAAYLRITPITLKGWETGASPVPFIAFELLRLVSESIRFKMSHAAWDGWFISEKGVLVSPDLGGRQGQFTPERLNWLSWNTNEAAMARNEVARLQGLLDETIAANTALREMFLNNGVTDEVAAMQERVNALMSKINTARVIPFASTAIEQQQEKAA